MRKLKNEELKRPDTETFKNLEKLPVCLVLDNVRSLYNVGSVFRTSDAFLIEKIYLCGITGTPPHKEIRKTALGADQTVDWVYFSNTVDAIAELRSKDCKILSIEQAENAIPLHQLQLQPTQKIALIFGHEVQGVSQEIVNLSDQVIEIPQLGTKHSLNVSVSAGLVVWEVFRQIKLQIS